MKKLICLISLCLLNISAMAHIPSAQNTLLFDRFPLELTKSSEDEIVYQLSPKNPYREVSLTITNMEKDDFEIFFWSELNERDENGNYQTKEPTFVSKEPGKQDFYIQNRYYLINNNDKAEKAVFTITRAKETSKGIRVYEFSFSMDLQVPFVPLTDEYDNLVSLPPAEVFKSTVRSLSEHWINALLEL